MPIMEAMKSKMTLRVSVFELLEQNIKRFMSIFTLEDTRCQKYFILGPTGQLGNKERKPPVGKKATWPVDR